MEDTRFYIGLQMSIETAKNNVTTRLLGWEIESFIMTRYPFVDNKPINLKGKDKCVIRFIKDGAAYGFTTEVLSLQFHPAPLIFFKYPSNIESMPFRDYKRFKTNINARFEILGTEKTVLGNAIVIDISEGGACLKIPDSGHGKIIIGSKCYLNFMIMDKSLEIDCVVRNLKKIKKGDDTIGVKFESLTPSKKEVLSLFIDMLVRLAQ